MATSEGNRRLEAVRWKEAVAVQETLHSQLASVELRNKDLEVAAARLFQELGEMRTGSSSSLEARLSKGEQMLSSINATLTDLEKARDEEVAKLQESLATCQAETRRLRFEQQAVDKTAQVCEGLLADLVFNAKSFIQTATWVVPTFQSTRSLRPLQHRCMCLR